MPYPYRLNQLTPARLDRHPIGCWFALIALMLVGCSAPSPAESTLGLKEVACWFDDTSYLPTHRCLEMTVTETDDPTARRLVTFPVLVFDSPNPSGDSPVLHLGGGGPGGAMALQEEYTVLWLHKLFKQVSLELGRDLYVIDPRGTGLAKPLLMCQTYIENELRRWKKNLSLEASYASGDADYRQCIAQFTQHGTDFERYSSPSVVADIDALRRAAQIERWVLYGGSYGTVYAQLYARQFPQHVESMILDSATFLDIPYHEIFVRDMTRPYEQLFGYCSQHECDEAMSPPDIERTFWSLVAQLDETPLEMVVHHPFTGSQERVVLTGWRFLDSVVWATYGEDIFPTFPSLLQDMQRGDTTRLTPHVEELLYFLLDHSYGDISASAHFCVDKKPYIDQPALERAISTIPYSYVRNIAAMSMRFSDYCDDMNIPVLATDLADPILTDVPTLFIHGELDSVTLLEHVEERVVHFSNHHLAVSAQSHIVLDDPCVQQVARQFVVNALNQPLDANCRRQ
ncbi:MAG: alpha/beta fold hydrolase [Pseudomonadota bacterium]